MKLMNEQDQRIYREELAPYLPHRIFDAHVHVFSKDFFPPDFAFPPLSVYNKFGGKKSLPNTWTCASKIRCGRYGASSSR